MRRPKDTAAKSGAVGRFLVMAGRTDVDVEREKRRVTTDDLALHVFGRALPHGWTPNQVLAALRADHPYRSSVVVRCVDPEIEGALVTMRLDEFVRIYCNEE